MILDRVELAALIAIASVILALILLWRQQQKTQRMILRAVEGKDHQLIITLADNSTDAIYVKDIEGRYLLANREAVRLLAKTAEHILGRNDTALFSLKEAALVRANDLRVISENQISTHEETLTTIDGERTYLATKGPMRDGNGLVIGIFGISRDITERKLAENTLRQSEERLQLVLRGSGDAPWDWNLESGDLYYSPRWWAMLGYATNELPMGASLWEHIVHPEDQMRVNQAFDHVINSASDTYDIEFSLQHKNGHYVPVHSRGFILRNTGGKPVRVSGTNTDLTERKQSEEKLQLSASVFSHAREGIMITDSSNMIIEVNEAFTRITGYSREEALGQSPNILDSGRQCSEFYVDMKNNLIENGHWYGEIWNRRKNGEIYAEILTISAVQDASGVTQQYVSLFSDITMLKEHESQLKHIAHFDALTGLPNRVLLADRLRQAMTQAQRREQRLAVVFLDLDAFKIINDTHGHATGDHLLKTVADRMKMALRDSDTIARIGGDEFVAVLLDLDNTNACEPMLSRLIAAAAQPVHYDGHVLQVTASLGVTFYPQTEDVDANKLLRQADQAMYLAKLEGKNCYQIFNAE
ncbi:MAG: PAS domain S-box protein [Betaproteobacteria bacterium]